MKLHSFRYYKSMFQLRIYKFFDNLDENLEKCTSPILRSIFSTTCITLLTTLVFAELWIIYVPYYWMVLPRIVFFTLLGLVHWVLGLFYWNMYMAKMTHAGTPNQKIFNFDGVNFCSKCNKPKPMRTHHCSICNTCILKMDHHCPWLNHCIGFYNHRYFYIVVTLYTFGGILFYLFGYPIFLTMYDVIIYQLEHMDGTYTFMDIVKGLLYMEDPELYDPFFIELGYGNPWKRTLFLVPMVLNIPPLCIQLAAFFFHTSLINNGETSIELHINRTGRMYAKAKGLVYTNYFDHGPKKNWEKFLGLENGKSFFWNIMIPCKYCPLEDGHNWERIVKTIFENI